MDIQKYTDKYFTHTRQILEGAGLDPWVKMQVFIRKGPGRVYGINEAIAMLRNSGMQYVGGSILALPEGAPYTPGNVVMFIEAPLRVIVEYETIYLGIISKHTTLGNGGVEPGLLAVEKRVEAIKELIGDRNIYYFGARHWHYLDDSAISKAAMRGGALACSTDASGHTGVGTMPHALVIACGGTGLAAGDFHKYIDPSVKRVVLVDTFNKEITDALDSLGVLWDRMGADSWRACPPGIRLDTCGENIGEGCHTKGVSVELARKVRIALDSAGYSDVSITLSSGFADLNKVFNFVRAEKILGIKLFDSLGVGQLWDGISATSDIIEVDGECKSKTGREAKTHSGLVEVVW